MKVSVIIPVHNKRPFVEACLRSVLSQDMDDFEVVAVDDGSTDGSLDLCLSIAREDERLRVIPLENGGVTRARRTGVEAARGRYVTFVDSDDRMKPGGLKTLYEAIVREEADEVVATYDTLAGRHVSSGMTGPVSPDLMLWQLSASKARFCILWAVIFRKEILDGCLREARVRIRPGQDILMQMLCLVKRPRVVFIPDCVYEYAEGLTTYKEPSLEAYKAFDEVLMEAFRPRWEELRDVLVMRQLKSYEVFLDWKQFDAYEKYYYQTRKNLSRRHPLTDRLIIMLPPRVAFLIVRLRKWWGRRHRL